MSNLANQFDVLRGWPDGAAIPENFAPDAGVTLVEGMLAVIDGGTGNLAKPAAVAVQGDVSMTKFRMVIQGNDQFDGQFTGKVVTLRGNFTVATDQFVAGAYTPGQLLTVHIAVDADQGKLTARTGANEQIVGEVEAYDSVNGILTVSMSI